MSTSSWNFKDNLTVDNNKYLKFLSVNGAKNEIIGINTMSNLNINSPSGGNIYINSPNTFVSSKLAVGLNSTSNNVATLILPINNYIGLNATTGFLGLVGGNTTTGGKVLLDQNNINLYTGTNTAGSIKMYTDTLKVQILNDGTVNFQPDGVSIKMSITDTATTLTHPLIINSTNSTENSLQVSGRANIDGDINVTGKLIIDSVSGNIDFKGTSVSTSYSSGSTYFYGGLGIMCSVEASSETAGGGLSIAGGLALGKNAIMGGNLTILNSDQSTSAVTGSGVFYGGLGVNGQVNIRSNNDSQIKLIPLTNNHETSILFGNKNEYSTVGSWKVGQNVNSIGNASFAIVSADNGAYVTFDNNQTNLTKYTNMSNTLHFAGDNIIDFDNTWKIGKNTSGNLHISRDSGGNLIERLLVNESNITILGTENSTSETSGGALTIAGGASIAKDLHIGGSIISGNVTFSGSLQSNSANDSNTFSYLTLTSTDEAINITSGSLVTFGGISIQCSTESSSPTNGGGLTVAGGAAVVKSMYIGNNLMVTNSIYAVNINSTDVSSINNTSVNASISNLNVNNASVGNVNVTNILNTNITSTNLNVINSQFTNVTVSNINGANGIITNQTTINQLTTNQSTSNQFTINQITTNQSTSNQFTINQSTSNQNVISQTVANQIVDNVTATNLYAVVATIGTLFTTNGNIGINNINPSRQLTVGSGSGNTSGIISGTISINSSSDPRYHLYNQGNVAEWALGQKDNVSHNFTITKVHENNVMDCLTIDANNNFVGVLTTTPEFALDINGTIRSQSTIHVKNTSNNMSESIGAINVGGDIVLSNSTKNTLLFSQSGVSPPTFNVRSQGTKIVLYPDTQTNSMDTAIGVENNGLWFNSGGAGKFKWYSNTTSANMFLSPLGLGINTENSEAAFTLDVNGTGRFKDNIIGESSVNTIGNIYTTNSNVGIGVTAPSATLDISGSIKASSSLIAMGTLNTLANLFTVNGNIGIHNTSPNQMLELSPIGTTANGDGGLRISNQGVPVQNYIDLRLKSNANSEFRGSIIAKCETGTESEYISFSHSQSTIYSRVVFQDGTPCSNSSVGSVVLQGGLAIDCPTNATSVSNGGALTISGGAAIAGDLIVGGTITYSNAAAASSTFAYLTLTATDWSTDIANGSLVVFGGISIQTSADAFSATEGNGLTVAGGVGIGASLYVGTTGYIPTLISTEITTENMFITNLTAGSIVSGVLTANGSVNISNTINSVSTTEGGALTVSGGVAILKDLYVGGTVTSSSDLRLKNNLRNLGTVLDKIGNIRTVKYNMNSEPEKSCIGFIAQDFEKDFPEVLARQSLDAYYSLAYDRITVLNMKCIKELKQENDYLRERLDELEKFLYSKF